MKNFYLSWKFCTLTITVFGKECLRNVLNTSRRRVNKNSLTWWYVLKTSWRYLCKTSWRSLEDVLKTFWRRLEAVLKTSWRRFRETSLKTFWRRLEDVLKVLWQDVLKSSWRRLEDVWPRWIYWPWPKRL